MKLTLAENIRAFRKERRLTQERLAEVLGVTTGAVYKWESGLSTPDLDLIVEMADFFDTSVDVLLGYRMKDNRLESTLQRLSGYCRTRDPEALTEAEKALKKYPNSFEIVLRCAHVHLFFAGGHDGAKARRALELLEQARLLISQNTDPTIDEATLFGDMAGAYFLLGEWEKGVDLLTRHNANQIFSDSIGAALACFLNRPKEAGPFLSEALLRGLILILNAVFGYVFVFCSRGDYPLAREIVTWGIQLFLGIKDDHSSDFMDKTHAELLVLLAHTQLKDGMPDAARASLQEARALARRFDASPDYGIGAIRFAVIPESTSMSNILGPTAAGSIESVLRLTGNQALRDMWEGVKEHE